MNGIGTATTKESHYAARYHQRTQTRTESFGKTLTEAAEGAGSRDAFTRTSVTETVESSYEYAGYSACLSGLSLRMGEISSTSGIIGLGFVRGTEETMSARIDKSSTVENPVVLVQVGSGENRKDYRININEVDPENATELEMFALLNYIDAQNGKTMAPDGAWQTYNSLRNRLEETEAVDNVTGKENYDTLRVNWLELIQQAMENELLRQQGWFAESFFTEDLDKLYNELSAYRKEPEESSGTSFWDLMNSGRGRAQIPTIDRIVSARNPEDNKIYVTFFARESITCHNADGTTAWELKLANDDQAELVKKIFAGFAPDREKVREYYSDAALGFVASKNFWLEFLSGSVE
ncbi:MAG: hypothetical protein K2H41_01665 [Acetatifactor sp.]|nr:hypothetical protein [Acetatifactor sp.]